MVRNLLLMYLASEATLYDGFVSIPELADSLLRCNEILCSATKIGCRIADCREGLLPRQSGYRRFPAVDRKSNKLVRTER